MKTMFAGSFIVFILDILAAYFLGISFVWYISSIFLIIVGLIFFNKNKELQQLQQSHIVNMALFVYISNQNVFKAKGLRVQMGYMGHWLEIFKDKNVKNA